MRIRRNNNHGLQKKSQLYFQKAPTVFFKQKHQLWNNAGNRDFLYMKYAKIYQNHLLYQNITIKQKEIQQLFFLNVGKKPKRYTLAPINTRPICSVWSKIGTFQRSLVHMKSASITLSTLYVFTTIESSEMRYCMNFYLKGHQKYEKSNFWLSRFT